MQTHTFRISAGEALEAKLLKELDTSRSFGYKGPAVGKAREMLNCVPKIVVKDDPKLLSIIRCSYHV